MGNLPHTRVLSLCCARYVTMMHLRPETRKKTPRETTASARLICLGATTFSTTTIRSMRLKRLTDNTSDVPVAAAECNGVLPCAFLTLTRAPASTSRFTTSLCRLALARCKTVCPPIETMSCLAPSRSSSWTHSSLPCICSKTRGRSSAQLRACYVYVRAMSIRG